MGGQFKKLKWSLDDLDLTKPIEPLSRFIDEPEKLIDEVFKIAAQYLHKDIVPSSLKDIPTVELKKLCLEQLKKVERKTLLNILTDESNELAADQCGSNLNETKETESIASGSGLSKVEIQGKINSQVTNEEKDKNDQSKKKKNKRSKQESSSPGDEVKPEEKSEVSNPVESSNLDSILDQAAVEIRELEIRAQAIRELLKKHEDADNADQVNAEQQKESRKRQRIDSTTHEESTNVQKDKSSNDKSKVVPINMPSQMNMKSIEQKSKEVTSKTPATSRLSRNPVSMVEEDESDNLPSSSTSDTNSKRPRKRTSDESNMMIQLNNDSDDSIDRELKGE